MIVGFDISTTCIGVAIFKNNGELYHIEHILLKIDKNVLPENRYIPKGQMFEKYLIDMKEKYDIDRIFVEEPLPSSNNTNTVNTLLRFNGICTWLIHKNMNVIPEFLSVREIRKKVCPEFIKYKKVKGEMKEVHSFPKEIDKKLYIFEKIKKKYPHIQWLYNRNNNLKKENFDMTDAVAICWAFFITEDINFEKEYLI